LTDGDGDPGGGGLLLELTVKNPRELRGNGNADPPPVSPEITN
jgi:hypothetical protein